MGSLKKKINLDILILIVLLFVLNPLSYKYLWDNDGALSNEKILLLTFNTTLIIFFLAKELISVLTKKNNDLLGYYFSFIVPLNCIIFLFTIEPFSVYRVIFILAIFLYLLLNLILQIHKKNSSINKNIFLLGTSIYSFFLLMELILMFYPKSHGSGQNNLASKLWFKKYWKTNYFGFRNDPFNISKKNNCVIFLGDSFTVGHGVKVNERFSDILKNELQNYEVINLGVNGSNSKEQFSTLKNYLEIEKRDVPLLVYQYFGNDIEKSHTENKTFFLKNNDTKKSILYDLIINNSFFINYVYWSFSQKNNVEYKNELIKYYSNSVIFKRHLTEVSKITDFCLKNKIQLITIIFPFMDDFESSQTIYIDRIKQHFKGRDISTIDVSALKFKNRSLVVNNFDAHPSAYVHSIVADTIAKIIKKKLNLN